MSQENQQSFAPAVWMTMVAVAFFIVLLSLGRPALAQSALPTSWTVRYYLQGNPRAVQTFTILAAQAVCDQPPPPVEAVPVVNPTMLVWEDPAKPNRVCTYNDSSRLGALPDGNYANTMAAVNAAGASAESAFVRFVRRRPTGARGR